MSTWPEPPNYYDTPTKGFKVMLQTPGFPVIYPDPSISQVVSNMRSGHWSFVAGMATAGYVLGYWKGSGVHWQKPASMFGAVFMGQFGMLHMMQDSASMIPYSETDCHDMPSNASPPFLIPDRLMGFKENAKEVAKNLPGVLAKESY